MSEQNELHNIGQVKLPPRNPSADIGAGCYKVGKAVGVELTPLDLILEKRKLESVIFDLKAKLAEAEAKCAAMGGVIKIAADRAVDLGQRLNALGGANYNEGQFLSMCNSSIESLPGRAQAYMQLEYCAANWLREMEATIEDVRDRDARIHTANLELADAVRGMKG